MYFYLNIARERCKRILRYVRMCCTYSVLYTRVHLPMLHRQADHVRFLSADVAVDPEATFCPDFNISPRDLLHHTGVRPENVKHVTIDWHSFSHEP